MDRKRRNGFSNQLAMTYMRCLISRVVMHHIEPTMRVDSRRVCIHREIGVITQLTCQVPSDFCAGTDPSIATTVDVSGVYLNKNQRVQCSNY